MEDHNVDFKDVFYLDELNFSNVIDGLNKYFSEYETNVPIPGSFIEVKSDKDIFIRFDAEMYLDKLIAWLRIKHWIFYYPGMEAKYAKTERIPPFTERMMDNGALRTLKKLRKIVTGVEVSDKADSPTLIAAAIENDFAVLKKDLKNALEAKESFFETKGKLNYRRELMEYITKTEKKYGICFSDLHDDEEFRPECVFDDLLEALKKREAEIKEVNEKRWKDLRDINKALGCSGMNGHVDDFAKAVKVRAEYAESLSRNTERSDINKLIRDYCTKNNIIPPSPYFSDKACVEYLFSVVDLEREHRAAVGKQMVDDYEKDLLRFIYKEYENRANLSDETITYNPQNIRNTIVKIISDYARNRTRVDILETRIKSIFDKYKARFTVDDYVINGDPTVMFMLDCISTWIRSSTESKEECRMTQNKPDTIEKMLEELLKDIKEE